MKTRKFPRLMYHAVEGSRVVATEELAQALEATGWSDDIPEPAAPPVAVDPIAALTARVEALEAKLAALQAPRRK